MTRDLEVYVAAVERHLSARRGAEHVLSPPDFALARSWHGAGVPLATLLAGIDRAFEEHDDLASLQACRRFVDALVGVEPPARNQTPGPAREPEELLARLLALREALAHAARPAAFERVGRRLTELIDLASVAREPNWAYLRSKLEELDALVEDAALEALPEPARRGFEAETLPAVERLAERVAPAALEEARRRHLRRRARERLRLPRVGGD